MGKEEVESIPEGEQADDLDALLSKAIEEQSEAQSASDGPDEAEDQAQEAGDGKAEGESSTEPEAEEKVEIPADFPADQKEALGRLPVEAQKAVLDTYKNLQGAYTRKYQEVAEQRKQIEPLVGVVKQWQPYFQALGVPPEQSFSMLIQADAYLRNPNIPQDQKVKFVRNFTRDYGIDLASPEGAGTQEYVDPQIAAIRQELSREIGGLREKLSQAELREKREREAALGSQIQEFAGAKDAEGKAAHPHFDRVRPVMGRLLAAEAAVDLSDAYEKAVRMDPELFNQMIEAERKKVADAEEGRRKEAVDKAKAAKSKGSGKATPHKGGLTSGNLDDILSAAIAKHSV